MNPLKQKMVLKKLNQIQPEDLMKYAKEIDETLTPDQAQKAASLVNGNNINIFNPNERLELLKKISQIINPQVARKLNELFFTYLS